MHDRYDTERALQEQFETVLARCEPSVDVRDVEYEPTREFVRLYISSPSGVDLDLCTRVTHAVRDVCPEYALEVSSPGLEPPLRRPEHYRDAIGASVSIRRRGGKRSFTAQLTSADDTVVRVRRGDATEEAIPYTDIIRGRLLAGAGDDPATTKEEAAR